MASVPSKTFRLCVSRNFFVKVKVLFQTNSDLRPLAYRSNFIIEDPDYRYLDAGESNKDNTGNANEYALFSL